MILFTILAITIATIAAFIILTAGIGGVTILILFGDAIVCGILIIFIVKCLRHKTWKNK